jgi:hypothetical protein
MIGAGCLEKLLEVISGLPCLALEITLSNGDELVARVIGLLVIVALVTTGSDSDSLGSPLRPLLLPLALRFVPLLAALSGAPRLPPGAAFSSPWQKTALIASSLEACQVPMSSSSFMVFG